VRGGSLVKAVLAGLAVDVGGTFIASGFLAAYGTLGSLLTAFQGGAESLSNLDLDSPTSAAARFVSIAVGAGFSLLGGYVAGSLHPVAPIRAGLLLGIASCLTALALSAAMGSEPDDLSLTVVEYGLTLVAAALGGGVALMAERRRAAERPDPVPLLTP
jgi:hypothetical protein